MCLFLKEAALLDNRNLLVMVDVGDLHVNLVCQRTQALVVYLHSSCFISQNSLRSNF